MVRIAITAISAVFAFASALVIAAEPFEEVHVPPPSYFRPVANVRANTSIGDSARVERYLGPIGSYMPQSMITSSAVITDFGSLHTFNVFFDRIRIAETFAINGGELMKQHVLSGPEGVITPWAGWRGDVILDGVAFSAGEEVIANGQSSAETHSAGVRNALQAIRFAAYTTYGLRYAELESGFTFDGAGSILGRTGIFTEVDHNLIGPQIGVGAVAESDIWRFESVLLTTLGYQRIDYEQASWFGVETVHGTLNRPMDARDITARREYGEEHVAWLNELRLMVGCRLTPHLRIDGGWRGALATQFHGAADATSWKVPYFGILPRDGETVVFDYWTLGLTYEF